MNYLVVTASRQAGIGNGLTYSGPDGLRAGTHVKVPLRRLAVDGIVIGPAANTNESYDVKAILSVSDRPLLNEAQIKTVRWMSDRYRCSLRKSLQVWLPAPPWGNLVPPPEIWYRRSEREALPRGVKQLAIIEALSAGARSASALKDETGATAATLKSLLEADMIEITPAEEEAPIARKQIHADIVLSDDQQKVYEQVRAETRPSLLFGVTGSGKTEIYTRLIIDCVNGGKQALLLLPEIFLTENFVERFTALVGAERLAVWHSRLSPGERRAQWRRIQRGDVHLVLGSRSAVFTPLTQLGLVMIDEEHEWTYKHEQAPRYDARIVAEELCQQTKAKLVFGSATPSLERWYRTKDQGTVGIHLARLDERYGSQSLPKVLIVDLADVQFADHYPFSPTLLSAIEDRLKRNEQSVLFLNRRGHASALLCLDCRRRVISPDSQLPFTVHHKNDGTPYLSDHTTGLNVPLPSKCPSCQSTRLHPIGAGTQRVEQILQRRFPKARLVRADRDTLQHPDDMKDVLHQMKSGSADILLGTQSVVKGLDLPGVTLAAVLLADVGLSLPHYRAGERIFQL